MKKFNNKGLTLLELIIAMSILTSVMFVGYNIFNKYSTLIHTQVNINKGQLNMNTINEYLTKDLEQTTSIELKIDGVVVADTKVDVEQKSTDKVLESAKQKIEDRLNENNNFNYEYKLRFNDEGKFSIYKVNIEKNNKAMKYAVSLTDKNGTKVDFINKELLREKEVPFYIIGDDPYKVSMSYSDKKNKFKLHEFEVTSRIKQDLVSGEVMPQPPTEPDVSEPSVKPDTPQSPTEPDSTKPPTDDNLSNQVNGDLIFELTKLNQTQNSGEYYWKKEVKYNMLDKATSSETQTNKHNGYSENFNILLKNDSNSSIESHIGGQAQTTIYDSRIKNIIGMKIKLDGDIKITNFNFPNYGSMNLNDTQKVYEFKGLSKQQHNINGNIEISSNGSVGAKSRLIIDFIYEG